MSILDETQSFTTTPSRYELLFKSSTQVMWNEGSVERSTIPSVTSGRSVDSIPSVDNTSKSGKASTNLHKKSISFSYGGSSLTSHACSGNSLQESEETSETDEREEQTEIEEDSLDISDISDEELAAEDGCDKEDGNPVDYLDKEVFPVLLPCLEKMLFAAKENDVLKSQKSRFNGLDYLAELLWNQNPLHPERHGSYVPLFEIPFVQKHLEENPRPIIPQSWLSTRDQAATVIQAAVRGFLVRCQPQVQELRQFWKALAEEKSKRYTVLLDEKQSKRHTTLADEKQSKRPTVLNADKLSNMPTLSQTEGRPFGAKQTTIDVGSSNYSFFNQFLNGNKS